MTEEHARYDEPDVDDPVDEEGPDDFLTAMRKALRPEVLARAGVELAEVIRSVREVGKKGSLTLTVSLTPMKNNPDVAEVTARVKSSPAEPTPRATPMWPTESGRLERNDPRQQALPGIRAVDDR